MEQYKNALEEIGIRPTYQRLKIFEYLKKHKDHPTIDIIYEALVPEIPTMSKTTVYNTLVMLFEKKLANQVLITGTEVRYDAEIEPHHHLLCNVCGKIYDLDIQCRYFKQGEVDGHKIDELHGYYKGTCRHCLTGAAKAKKQ